MANTIVKVGIAGAIIYWLLAKFDYKKFYDFTFKGISFGGNLLQPTASFQLGIINKTPLPVIVSNLTGIFYLNSDTVQIGEVGNFTPVQIAAEQNNVAAESAIDIPINIYFNGIVQTIKDLINGSASKSTIIFKGSVTANDVSLPLNLTFSMQ